MTLEEQPTVTTPASSQRPRSSKARPKETKHLHFDLSHYPNHDDFTLRVGARKHPLRPHSAETRSAAGASNALLGRIHPDRLTHFVEGVELPADAPVMLRVTSSKLPAAANIDTLAIAAIHIPTESRNKALIERWKREDAAGLPLTPHPKLEAMGVKAPSPDASPAEKEDYQKLILESTTVNGAFDVATTLVMHHPELMSLDPDIHGLVNAHVEYAPGISDLARVVYEQAQSHAKDPTQENWVNALPAKAADLHSPDPRGKQVYRWSDRTKDSVAYPGVPGPLKAVLQITKNDADLKNGATSSSRARPASAVRTSLLPRCSRSSTGARRGWSPRATVPSPVS
jgi:hypothetical protein